MPRKKKTTTITEELPEDTIDVSPDSVDFGGGDCDGTLAAVLSQFGPANVKIKVSKMTPKGASYCFSTDEEVDEDFVQANYGGGKYACRIFINGEYKQTVNLNIAERLQPNTPSQHSQDSVIIAMMREQQVLLTSLLTKAIGGGGSAATPVGELTEAMKNIHGMNGGNGSFDAFLKGVEMAGRFGGNGERDWKSELLDTVREVVKPILPVIAGEMMRGKTAEQTQGQAQVTAGQPVDITNQIREGIAYLKKKALAGVDVNLILDWIIANATDYQQFLHVVLTTDFAKFASVDPEIANEPFATWFKNLYDGLRTAFNQSAALDDDSGGESGDGGNVVHDADFGNKGKQSGR